MLRWSMAGVGVMCVVIGSGLVVWSPSIGNVVLALVLVVLVGIVAVVPAWRGLIAVEGDTLTVRVGTRAARRINRDEITRIETSDFGIFIEYQQAGRNRNVIAEAAQGGLNSLGAWLMRRSSRSEEIAQRLRVWWHGPENSELHPN